MGKMSILTPEQKFILDQVKENDFLRNSFYFTGGTALSEFYLKHRYSQDLDFFSGKEFTYEDVLLIVQRWARKYQFDFKPEPKEAVSIFYLEFQNKTSLKIDFGYYPFGRLEEGLVVDRLRVDSLLDIAVNKLSTVNQRSQVKDFVDLYYLLEKHTIWDLIEGVRIKFRMELEPWILASDMVYAVDQFEYLPKMIRSLTLNQIKLFYRDLARKLCRGVVE